MSPGTVFHSLLLEWAGVRGRVVRHEEEFMINGGITATVNLALGKSNLHFSFVDLFLINAN